MCFFKNYLFIAAFFAAGLSAAAQDAAGTRTLILFEGQTINAIDLSGNFDVGIRQGKPGGIVLEIPQDIPVDTVYNPSYGDIEWMKQALKRNEEFGDTVRCALDDGMLRLVNTRLKIDRLFGGGFHTNWIPGPKVRAVITVGDLRTLQASTKGTVRFTGKMRTTETKLLVQSVDGLDLTARKRVSISTIGEGTQNIKISDTPQVEIKMNTKGTLGLSVDGVGYLSVLNYVDGANAVLSGTADALYTRTYGQGIIDTKNLKAGKVVQPKKKEDSGLSDVLGDGTYILEKKGKTINIREKK